MLKEGDVIKGGPFDGFEVISAYSRAQAIEDGVLVDLKQGAMACIVEDYFKVPVAMTNTAFSEVLDDGKGPWSLHLLEDMLTTMRRVSAALKKKTDRIYFDVVRNGQTLQLTAICGPGDHGEQVITIMFPGEE